MNFYKILFWLIFFSLYFLFIYFLNIFNFRVEYGFLFGVVHTRILDYFYERWF